MITEALNSAGWQPIASGFLPGSLITSTHDIPKANLKYRPSLTLNVQLPISSVTHSFFPFLASALSLIFIPSPPALSNLSVLFYLPEGECFWITGLINKVNTDRQPLTQHYADRAEKQLGTECVRVSCVYVCVCIQELHTLGLPQLKVEELETNIWGGDPKMVVKRFHWERCTAVKCVHI